MISALLHYVRSGRNYKGCDNYYIPALLPGCRSWRQKRVPRRPI